MNQQETEHLIHRFTTGTLPKDDWTHNAHLSVGIWFISQYEFSDAVCRIRSGIIMLNNVHGTNNTGSSGYHETMTIFWAQIISVYLILNKNASVEDLTKSFLASPLARKTLPFDFYERDSLLSSSHRAVFYPSSKSTVSKDTIGTILNKTV